MKLEFSNRFLADLRKVSAASRPYGRTVTVAVEARIHEVIRHIAEHPEAALRVEQRSGVHVIPLVRYPCKIFYRVLTDRVRILHIRHTSRRPWIPGG
jgi:plasmid stabilization system protein ParE